MFTIQYLIFFYQKIGLTTAKAGRNDQCVAESISAKFRFCQVQVEREAESQCTLST